MIGSFHLLAFFALVLWWPCLNDPPSAGCKSDPLKPEVFLVGAPGRLLLLPPLDCYKGLNPKPLSPKPLDPEPLNPEPPDPEPLIPSPNPIALFKYQPCYFSGGSEPEPSQGDEQPLGGQISCSFKLLPSESVLGWASLPQTKMEPHVQSNSDRSGKDNGNDMETGDT